MPLHMDSASPHPDQYLVDGLLQSKRLVIDEIYRRYFALIRKHVVQNSGRSADAKDLFQEALISIYKKRTDGGVILNEPFGSYLSRLCKWLWLNELKKRKRQGAIQRQFSSGNGSPHYDPNDPELERAQQEDQAFRNAFHALGALCKDILRLSWTGLNLKQIAGRIGKSHGYLRRKRPECVAMFIRLVKEESPI